MKFDIILLWTDRESRSGFSFMKNIVQTERFFFFLGKEGM